LINFVKFVILMLFIFIVIGRWMIIFNLDLLIIMLICLVFVIIKYFIFLIVSTVILGIRFNL